MKKILIFSTVFFNSLFSFAQSGNGYYDKGLSIWFDKPNTLKGKELWYGGVKWVNKKPYDVGYGGANKDSEWEQKSLPIGNGSIGANIMGSVGEERITFNEKTLWRGGPNTSKGADYYWNVNKQSAHILADIRKAFTEGDEKKATKLTVENFNGLADYEYSREKPFRFGNFTTAGEFHINSGIDEKQISDYQRILSVDSSLVLVRFKHNNSNYVRKYFVSYPDNIMLVNFKADNKALQNLSFSYSPNPISEGKFTIIDDNQIVYNARLDENNMQYVVRIYAKNIGGRLYIKDDKIFVDGADEVSFIITADTDYKMNFNPDFKNPKTYVGVNPMETTEKIINKVKPQTFKQLFNRHYNDYSELFNRVKINFNNSIQINKPTNVRLQEYREGIKDFGLEELYYQFGRYLLISSSRPGNMPANLQGMWHNNVDGPWHVDYHNNINLQMNYWPSCSTNLDECMLPLVDFVRSLIKPGELTAKSYFGARGWTASISGNIFGFTAPLSSYDMSWNFNPMAGPWLATHIWEYYDYTQDKKFLKNIGYDIIKSSADFTVDFLWKKDDGTYTAAPSTSPEHGPIDQGATFVHGVAREILIDAIYASEELGVDRRERRKWKKVLNKLQPYKIGRYGQLMEWSNDIDNPNDKHRHVNHLFGLHPGHSISPITTPEFANASRVVLEHRGDFATGWSMGWKLNQWARLHDGNHAYKLLGNLLKNGTSDNLWDTHPPFQIDGNFGGVSGITEMLVQSHMGFIHLLPALPEAWSQGSVKGLKVRGNFELDIYWKDGKLSEVRILSHSGNKCDLRYGDKKMSFKTKKGKYYSVLNNKWNN